MTCKEMEDLLPGMIDGALPDTEIKRIEAHLETCASCRKALADMRIADERVKNLEEVEPPPWLKTRVMAQIREEARQKDGILRKLFFPLHVKVSIQALVTVLIAFVAWNVYKTGEPEFRQVAPPSTAVQEAPLARVPQEPAPAAGISKRDESTATREKKTFAPQPPAAEDRRGRNAETVREAAKADIERAAGSSEAARPAGEHLKDEETLKGAGAALRQETDRAVPAPAMEHKQKALKAPAGSAAKESRKREGASPASPMLSTAVASRADLEMTLRSADPAVTAVRAETILRQFSAQSVDRQTLETAVVLTATIKPENLVALREKLKSLGPIRERASAAPRTESDVKVRLEIRPE